MYGLVCGIQHINLLYLLLCCFFHTGRYDVALPYFNCNSCGHAIYPNLKMVIANRFWPSTPMISDGLSCLFCVFILVYIILLHEMIT